MKKLVLYATLLMIISYHQAIGQGTYRILKISGAKSITIGNSKKTVNDTFKDTDEILFPNDTAEVLANLVGTKQIHHFTKAQMNAKKAKTPRGYFANDYKKTKASDRGAKGNVPDIIYGLYDNNKYPEKRIALLIGNGNYKDDNLQTLPNAINDIRDVSIKLVKLGFDVVTLYDGDIADMKSTVSSFFQLVQNYQVALIYFAGHGTRHEGKDYLLSTDRKGFKITDECSLEFLVDESEKWKREDKTMIFVIDACRDNSGFSSKYDNLAIEAPKGTVIIQSTSSGEKASDADGSAGNSPFALAFMDCIGNTGGDIEDDFIAIRQQVRKKTNEKQIPRTSMGGGYNFYFCKTCVVNINPNDDTPVYTPKNSKDSGFESFEFCMRAAPKGDTSAQYYLGMYYNRLQQYDMAYHWFGEAAKNNHIPSKYEFGLCYILGNGVNKSAEQGVYWIRQAAEQGYPIAQCDLAYSYKIGNGVPQSYSKAVEWYKKSADRGNIKAKYELGTLYEGGTGVSKSYEKAAKLYEEAAESNHPLAQCRLGNLYYYGRGVKQSYDKAVYWFKKSSQHNIPEAINALGICYEHGWGINQSEEDAIQLYRLSATRYGYAEGQFNLGRCYYSGIGVKQSYSESIKWFTMAAEQNNANAQYALGLIYYTGNVPNTPQSYLDAVEWLKKAANNGNGKAQYLLGVCYEYGRGVSKSKYNAINWYGKAAKQGNKEAGNRLKEINAENKAANNASARTPRW